MARVGEQRTNEAPAIEVHIVRNFDPPGSRNFDPPGRRGEAGTSSIVPHRLPYAPDDRYGSAAAVAAHFQNVRFPQKSGHESECEGARKFP